MLILTKKDKAFTLLWGIYGESALPLVPDVITCIGSPVIDSAVLTRADKNRRFEDARIYCDENT